MADKRGIYKWIRLDGNRSLNDLVNAEIEVAAVSVLGKAYCLGYFDGTVRAFDKNCPHAGAGLDMGWINDRGCIVCPHHGYTYDLHSGKEVTNGGIRLKTYPVKETDEGIFIGLPKRKWLNWW